MATIVHDTENSTYNQEIKIDDAPNPYAVIHDHSKTVITLATAFLGLTVTFSTQLVGSNPSMWQIVMLGIVWLLLMVSIVSAIVAVVQLQRFLSKKLAPNSLDDSTSVNNKHIDNRYIMAFASSISYIILVIAGICFGVLGLTQYTNQHIRLDAVTVSEKVLEFMPSVFNDNNAKWKTIELRLNENINTYQVIVLEEKSGQKFSITIDAQQGRILQYKLLP